MLARIIEVPPGPAVPGGSGRSASESEAGTSAVEYAFLIAGILAVLVALGFAVLHVVQDGLPASCDSTTTSQVQDGC